MGCEPRQWLAASIERNRRHQILAGRGDMGNFCPLADITRAEMAVALVALLDHAPGAPVHKGDDGLYVLGSPGSEPDDWFADARAGEPRSVDDAISAACELGIASGVGDGSSFGPGGSVPRRDMATFVVRAMAHSNLRPAGLTAQLVDGDVVVSLRDSGFAPVLNEHIDAFAADAANESRAFNADGACSGRTTAVEGNSKCEIGGGDPVTQSDGNVGLARVTAGEGKTTWVWTGSLGDKVSSSTVLFELSVPKTEAKVTAGRAVVSNDLPKDPNAASPTDVSGVRFGRTVTVTIQLKGASGGADADRDANPAKDRTVEYTVVTSERTVDAGGALAAAAVESDTQTVKIGADGEGTFTVTAAGPDPRRGMSNRLAVRYAVSVPDPGGAAAHTLGVDPPAASSGDVIFTDAAPEVSYVSIEDPGPRVAPGPDGRAAAAVTIKVLDQYGEPFRGAPVFLDSDDETGAGDETGSTITSRAFSTGAAGTVRMTYTYSGDAREETLRASWDGSTGGGSAGGSADTGTVGVETAVGSDAQAEDVVGTTTVRWVLPCKEKTRSAASVLSLDAAGGQIVIDLGANQPNSVNFDANDYFTVTSANTALGTRYMTMADFVEELTKELAAAKATAAADQPTLGWQGYTYDDAAGSITSFTLTLGGGRQRRRRNRRPNPKPRLRPSPPNTTNPGKAPAGVRGPPRAQAQAGPTPAAGVSHGCWRWQSCPAAPRRRPRVPRRRPRRRCPPHGPRRRSAGPCRCRAARTVDRSHLDALQPRHGPRRPAGCRGRGTAAPPSLYRFSSVSSVPRASRNSAVVGSMRSTLYWSSLSRWCCRRGGQLAPA